MTLKFANATRKYEIPTSTGIFWRKRKGARIGSGATYISLRMKRMTEVPARVAVVITRGLPHCIPAERLD